MRHRVAGRKLGRTSAHRLALMRNMSEALFRHERIRTTVHKAKELRPFAERLITRAKSDSVHARRIIARDVRNRDVARKLFDTLAPRYVDRPGGYTRIMRLGPRPGDGAEMAFIELVDAELAGADEPAARPARKRGRLGKIADSVRGKGAEKDEADAEGTAAATAGKKAAKASSAKTKKKSSGKKTAKTPAKKKAGKKKTERKKSAKKKAGKKKTAKKRTGKGR